MAAKFRLDGVAFPDLMRPPGRKGVGVATGEAQIGGPKTPVANPPGTNKDAAVLI